MMVGRCCMAAVAAITAATSNGCAVVMRPPPGECAGRHVAIVDKVGATAAFTLTVLGFVGGA